jgi:hypothetical protein
VGWGFHVGLLFMANDGVTAAQSFAGKPRSYR